MFMERKQRQKNNTHEDQIQNGITNRESAPRILLNEMCKEKDMRNYLLIKPKTGNITNSNDSLNNFIKIELRIEADCGYLECILCSGNARFHTDQHLYTCHITKNAMKSIGTRKLMKIYIYR